MFFRFASGSAIACIVIAIAALVVMLTPGLFARVQPVAIIWCFVPLAWGIWAVLAPGSWVPRRLPHWGAVLGLIAGLLGALVLNLPARVLGLTLAVPWRTVAVLVMTAVYYFLWMLVRRAYLSLTNPSAR
jgi:hypothetical protein